MEEQTPEWEVVFEWNSLEHIPVSDSEYFNSLPYYKINNINDYIHINSVFEDTEWSLLISSRHLNEVTKIDRNTGNIIWRLWWKQSDFKFINDPLGWFNHQHTATVLDNGNILIYDNWNLHSTKQTRVVEYKLDEASKTASLVWSYQIEWKFTYATWSAQRLKNGNTFIWWWFDDTNLRMTEVNKNKEKIYDIFTPNNRHIYRAFKEF